MDFHAPQLLTAKPAQILLSGPIWPSQVLNAIEGLACCAPIDKVCNSSRCPSQCSDHSAAFDRQGKMIGTAVSESGGVWQAQPKQIYNCNTINAGQLFWLPANISMIDFSAALTEFIDHSVQTRIVAPHWIVFSESDIQIRHRSGGLLIWVSERRIDSMPCQTLTSLRRCKRVLTQLTIQRLEPGINMTVFYLHCIEVQRCVSIFVQRMFVAAALRWSCSLCNCYAYFLLSVLQSSSLL